MNQYLNKIYQNPLGEIVGIELVEFDNNEYGHLTFRKISKDNFKSILNEDKIRDFSVNEKGDIIVNHYVKKSNEDFKEGTHIDDSIISLYSLIEEGIKLDALISPKLIENNYKGFITSVKNIRVSSSTMKIVYSYLNDDGNFRTSKLVYMDEYRRLISSEFYLLVPEENLKDKTLINYNITKLGCVKVNNCVYIQFKYCSCRLPLCGSTSGQNISGPVIAHYSYSCYLNKNILRLLEALKDDLVDVEPHKYPKPKEDEKIREYHEEDFIGIFFKLNNLKDLKKKEAKAIASTIKDYYKKTKKEIPLNIADNIVSQLELPSVTRVAIKFMINAINKYGISYDLLEYVNYAIEEFNNTNLKQELFLFNIRVLGFYSGIFKRTFGVDPNNFLAMGSKFLDGDVAVTIISR